MGFHATASDCLLSCSFADTGTEVVPNPPPQPEPGLLWVSECALAVEGTLPQTYGPDGSRSVFDVTLTRVTEVSLFETSARVLPV
jgi:hypothetical protein